MLVTRAQGSSRRFTRGRGWAPLRVALLACIAGTAPPALTSCTADCNTMDAQGQGSCDTGLGYARTQSELDCACGPVVGCACVGSDCDRLFLSYEACAATVRLEY